MRELAWRLDVSHNFINDRYGSKGNFWRAVVDFALSGCPPCARPAESRRRADDGAGQKQHGRRTLRSRPPQPAPARAWRDVEPLVVAGSSCCGQCVWSGPRGSASGSAARPAPSGSPCRCLPPFGGCPRRADADGCGTGLDRPVDVTGRVGCGMWCGAGRESRRTAARSGVGVRRWWAAGVPTRVT
ncbi:hypothetical protein [Streptomyces sp. NEAU-YJ-81]|uniref:hypothetical protein n=1 Tax=Streptomyces sp. NEAU-YJ-81 TaxID=2820288 RepID=UPI001FBA7985|nr:hypothetical protein [Streptomyces sp. NEAU-YJ-81]